ncbi:hypothetical protein CKO18_11715 [Rhodoferax fermentans]|uniref:FCP1 homology domain-containing protein n=2 Tax=Rhodoferax fermentans TaxID=28066 RepID=A0A1T1AY55_RHOFE|nr:hypothetical protein [Rhodoferax fermentans]OOV09052.1 hypothetical protein RF819_10455 [Rhodoferax fermentans]
MVNQQTLSDAALVVLYLDIDGVLHHEHAVWNSRCGVHMCPKRAPGRRLFEWLPILETILQPFPLVKLVLSSSWCVWPGYGKTLKRFPPALRGRFVGGTFHKRIHRVDPPAFTNFQGKSRAEQILMDVQRRRPAFWLALDDDADGWPVEAIDNFVKCDGSTGLSSLSVQAELKFKLERCYVSQSSFRSDESIRRQTAAKEKS